MARHVQGPWYRNSKGTWYATHNGTSVSLKVKGRENAKAAQQAWHRLMADSLATAEAPSQPKAEPRPKPEPTAEAKVGDIIRRYLADAESRVKSATLAVLRGRLKPLERTFDTLPASDFTEEAVRLWLRGRKLSQSSRHGVIGAVKACFAWAERKGIIPSSSVRHLERPPCQSPRPTA